jgi:hypothetical protein
MKKDKVYRYSLQFPGKTDEQVRVGELLEQLGSRKSRFIIRAISEYISTHPDEVTVSALPPLAYSREEMRAMLIELLAENGYITKSHADTPPSISEFAPQSDNTDCDGDTGEVDVGDLLANLDVFLI